MAALAALIAFLPRTGPAVGVTMRDFAFAPQALRVLTGDSITIRNDGDVTHTFTCRKCGVDSGNIQPGQAKVVRFARPGTYEFVCRYHDTAGMQGRVVVGSAPAESPAESPVESPAESPAEQPAEVPAEQPA